MVWSINSNIKFKKFDYDGLMQGCCHLICECDISIFSSELIEKAKKITQKVFKKFVKIHI